MKFARVQLWQPIRQIHKLRQGSDFVLSGTAREGFAIDNSTRKQPLGL
jgi:hypothetical protein